ncbi:LOB domain-containing protein 25-like [Phalaenopsis equestris]|uniref:LOB domain-containing protein 25-like n=1 Tax=Phalaenopsis equestris TaxID=78828 RepID=UPI0009E3446B|nr:LOB domain-containing protein 25-like [Phalaenopsis equestris]XP_020594390.1 LOB domain-containing protein 25-like [Phalaenopsis equestris]XP_020596227.1 LOB domain-containing protein 25-like [Phalaenopsis equestris]
MASSSNTTILSSPCAACKFLRRKCMPSCIFAPYFHPEEPQKFINVHKVFGASNVAKLLNDLLPSQREDAVNSLAYEAEARIKDPVYGCVGAISVLQRHIQRLQKELDATNAELLRYAYAEQRSPNVSTMISPSLRVHYPHPPLPAHGLWPSFVSYHHPHSQNDTCSNSSSGELNQRGEWE